MPPRRSGLDGRRGGGVTDPTDLVIDTAIHDAARGHPLLLDLSRILRITGGPVFVTIVSTSVVVLLLVTRRWGWAAYLAATALGAPSSRSRSRR